MSAERPKTREELYERIRQTSRNEFILEDMIRLGFWPERGVMPEDPRTRSAAAQSCSAS